MALTPFADLDANFGAAFGNGINSTIQAVLVAVANPLMATVTLWIIIQGILVMRGDLDTRKGVVRITKVAFVVGILTSQGLYTNYVQTLFVKGIPAWLASITAGSGPASKFSTPQNFDNMWSVSEHIVENIAAGLSPFDIADAISLVIIEFALLVILITTFAIYEFAIIVTGIIVAIGPIMIIGYLFEATKGVTDRWIGKLITYSILTLLVDVTLNVVLTGEKSYLKIILSNQISNVGAVTPTALALQIKTLFELAAFFAMGAFIVVSLPAIAAVIGGGHGGSPGAAIMSAMTGAAGRLGRRAATPPK